MSRGVAWPTLTAEPGIDNYFKQIQRFPMLDPQEEHMLAKCWREDGDRDAAHRLITSHLRLVVKIVRGYRGCGLPLADLISEGHVGLLQAIERFEPERGFRFSTYAVWWIKAAIQEYILRSWSVVRMGTTANHRKLFFNLRKAKSRISALDDGDMRPDQVKLIAKRLSVTERAVIDMNRRLVGDTSLNDPIREGRDSAERQDWLVSESPDQETMLADSEEFHDHRNALFVALGALKPRDRRIFESRRLSDDPITLAELADEFGVSRERVRQIEARAFEKVQKAVKNHVASSLLKRCPQHADHAMQQQSRRRGAKYSENSPVPRGRAARSAKRTSEAPTGSGAYRKPDFFALRLSAATPRKRANLEKARLVARHELGRSSQLPQSGQT